MTSGSDRAASAIAAIPEKHREMAVEFANARSVADRKHDVIFFLRKIGREQEWLEWFPAAAPCNTPDP
jgi:hypothetical protein